MSFNVTAVVDQPVIHRTQQQLMMALKMPSAPFPTLPPTQLL